MLYIYTGSLLKSQWQERYPSHRRPSVAPRGWRTTPLGRSPRPGRLRQPARAESPDDDAIARLLLFGEGGFRWLASYTDPQLEWEWGVLFFDIFCIAGGVVRLYQIHHNPPIRCMEKFHKLTVHQPCFIHVGFLDPMAKLEVSQKTIKLARGLPNPRQLLASKDVNLRKKQWGSFHTSMLYVSTSQRYLIEISNLGPKQPRRETHAGLHRIGPRQMNANGILIYSHQNPIFLAYGYLMFIFGYFWHISHQNPVFLDVHLKHPNIRCIENNIDSCGSMEISL